MVLRAIAAWVFADQPGTSSSVQQAPGSAPVAEESAPVAATSPAATDVGSHPTPSARVAAESTAAPGGQNVAGDSRGHWRVIAFTYSREDQAQQKAAEIAQSHPDLDPTVLRPRRARSTIPLVTIGSAAMSREESVCDFRQRQRKGHALQGHLPLQNYRSSRGRASCVRARTRGFRWDGKVDSVLRKIGFVRNAGLLTDGRNTH